MEENRCVMSWLFLFIHLISYVSHGCHIQHLFSCMEGLLSSLLPQVGMEFNTIDEAWMFWIRYGVKKALR